MRPMFALVPFIAIVTCVGVAQSEPANPNIAQQFIVNQQRPFTYLQFDHIGKGTRFNEDEPIYRIWFRLVNNSRVPIVIRTFGVPDGSPAGECGLFHNVVANPPVNGISGGLILDSGAGQKPAEKPAVTAAMPSGYDGDVSSTASLGPSESLLFSVPVNHLSDKWHIEIPFRFDLPHKRPSHYEAEIGGEPLMKITYWLSDLPTDIRKQIEAGIE